MISRSYQTAGFTCSEDLELAEPSSCLAESNQSK